MSFLNSMLSFPTVIFSFFLCICVILWLLTILGLFGFEAVDVDVDADIDFDVGDLAGNHGSVAGEAMGFLSRFGLNGVPITLMVTLLSLYGWMIAFFSQSLLLSHLGGLFYYLGGIAVFVGALIISVFLTGKTCKPLRGIFKSQDAVSNRQLLGHVAVVRSLSSDGSFGQALLEDGGAGLLLQICAYPEHGIKSGNRVVLLDYQAETGAYRVISEDEFKGI